MKRLALIFVLGLAALPGYPQQDTPPPEDDGPGRGVARLSVMNGEVSVRRGDSGDFIAAALNAPLVVTDRVVTGPQSRAEVQFDWANMIRIGSHSEIRLSELEYRRYQIQIAVGTTTFRVLRTSNADVEISTPSVSVRPLGIGVFRVMVREDGSSEITARSGEIEIFTPRGLERLRAGSAVWVRGSAQDAEFQQVAASSVDEWDRWNADRDRDLERSRSYQYVAQEITGAEDLEGHGRWVSAEGYGTVWTPAVDPGWAPYRYGRWVWEDYYGWTWVSYDPWGWAPYHYGRWFNSPLYGWCWWPGGIHERQYWRPALVAFFGFGGYGGSRPGIGFGFGNVGWVALAPHEPFHPWYGRSLYGGYRNTAVVNNTVINNVNIASVYRNARVTNGITAVSSEAFGRRGVSNSNLIRVDGNQLQNAGLVRGALPVTPARESLHLADRGFATAGAARVTENRSFYSRQTVRPVDRVPFEQQRQSIEQSAQRTFGGGAAAAARQSGWPTAPATDQGGWHRFGDPAPHANGGASPAGVQDNGWRRFGGVDPQAGRSLAAPSPAPPNDSNRPAGSGWDTGSPQRYRNFAEQPDGSRAVRINPPMVRQRPAETRPYEGSRGNAAPAAPAQRSNEGANSRGNSGGNGARSEGGHNRGR